MDAERFDFMTTALAGHATSRRALLSGLLGGAVALFASAGVSEGKRKRGKCKRNTTRCNGKCVNTNTDEKHCGACGNRCASGEQCLNGRCFSDDTCPFAQEACPNYRNCGIEDSDCFCGTTTGGTSVCFQDEPFCEEPRPCQSNNDCEQGRVCVDTSLCCADFQLPDVPRTCVLPCENPTTVSAKSGKSARNGGVSQGPGRAGS
jgi:hypothetical protein